MEIKLMPTTQKEFQRLTILNSVAIILIGLAVILG